MKTVEQALLLNHIETDTIRIEATVHHSEFKRRLPAMKVCPLCGKENKKRAELCSHCGFSFSGTGHIPGGRRTGAPAKEKKAGKILKITAVCLSVILVIIGAGFLVHDLRTMKWHNEFDPIIGISDGNVLLYDLQRAAAKPMKIAKLEGDDKTVRQYQRVYISKDRKALAFSDSFEYYDDYFSLQCDACIYDLEELHFFTKTVLRDVAFWTVSEGFDIFTYEKLSEGKLKLYQKQADGEEKQITDKYKVYSVSADGKELNYSGKSKKLNSEAGKGEKNFRTLNVKDLTAADKKGKITFSLDGNDVQADLPRDINIEKATLSVTEKGSALITDEESGNTFLLRGNRFVPFSEGNMYFLIPDYPKGEANIVNYDFSALPVK